MIYVLGVAYMSTACLGIVQPFLFESMVYLILPIIMVGLVFFTPFIVDKFKPIAIGPTTMGKAGTVLVLFMLQSTLVTRFAMLLTCVSTSYPFRYFHKFSYININMNIYLYLHIYLHISILKAYY